MSKTSSMSSKVTLSQEGVSAKFNDVNEQHVKSNNFLLSRVRTYSSVSAGVAAGTLGLSGISGFLFYVVTFFVGSIFLATKCEFKIKKYFPDPAELNFGGFSKDLVLYLMLWTIFHNLVNIL